MQLQKWKTQNKVGNSLKGYFRQGDNQPINSKESKQRLHFLHGTGFSSLCNAKLAEYLPANWDLWFTDVPGHGESEQPKIERMPNWLRMADSVSDAALEITDIKKKGKVIGVGHSLGGVLTLLAASRHPQNFSRIILFDPVLFLSPLVLMQHVARVTGLWKYGMTARAVNKRRRVWPDKTSMRSDLEKKALYKNWDQSALEYFIQSGTKINASNEIELACNPSWEASLFGSYPRELWKHVEALQVRTDIILPKNTLIFIPPAIRKAQKLNKQIHLHRFGEAHSLLNHCFPMEQPKETAELITKLISTHK